jgi:membrane protein implicated in regulation of membrane protease activity
MKHNVYFLVISISILMRSILNLMIGHNVWFAWCMIGIVILSFIFKFKYPQYRVYFRLFLLLGLILLLYTSSRTFNKAIEKRDSREYRWNDKEN